MGLLNRGIQLSPRTFDDATRALPLRPLPLGFAINTLIYSLAWLLILTAVSALRRRARIARSRCPACNYDLRGLSSGICPECGEPTPVW